MTYKRVTEEERRLINNWCQVGESLREMGRRFQRAASSISREIKRNKGGRGYRAKQAHEKAQARGRREGPRRFTPEVKEDVDLRLQEGWTPEIISQRARLEGRKTVCKETISQYIYAEAKVGGALWKRLRSPTAWGGPRITSVATTALIVTNVGIPRNQDVREVGLGRLQIHIEMALKVWWLMWLILILISSFWHTMMKILARASATKPSRVSNI